MHTDKDDIDKLFSRKLENFEVKNSEEAWLNLSSKLSKVNFLKFSFVSFNVYYLAVLAAFAGTAAFTTINNVHLIEKNTQLEKTLQYYQQKEKEEPKEVSPTDSIRITENPPADIKQIKRLKPVVEIKEENVKAEIKELPTIENNSKDTVRKWTPAIAIADTTNTVKVKKVKKTVMVKPRTVVVKDTVHVTKPNK